jgi:hypothetical protein
LGIPILIADRVVDYINEEKITGTLPKNDSEMPPCPMPARSCFIEWNHPPHIINRGGWHQGGAVLFRVTADENMQAIAQARMQYGDVVQSIYIIWFFSTTPDGRPTLLSDFEIALDRDSRPLGHHFVNATMLELGCDLELMTVMHTMAFFHCQNSSVVNVTRNEGPPELWCKQHDVPKLSYFALMIDGKTIRELTAQRGGACRPLSAERGVGQMAKDTRGARDTLPERTG